MLRNVIAAYLDQIKEREFDIPFMSLLSVMGFTDIHKTHGVVEFGKDFIAKKNEGDEWFQYSFQVKAGNISLPDWRNEIQGQMLQAVISGINHPNFDKDLKHIPIFVTTGELIETAAIAIDDFNNQLTHQYQKPAIRCWTKNNLLDFSLENGIEEFYLASGFNVSSYRQFFELYGKAMDGSSIELDFERHSRRWLENNYRDFRSLFVFTMECVILSQKLEESYLYYEVFKLNLCLYRYILFRMFLKMDDENIEIEQEIIAQLFITIGVKANIGYKNYKEIWSKGNKNLSSVIDGPGNFFTYLIHCSRVLEICGYLYFTDFTDKQDLVKFINEFINSEPGACHIPSDNYAISVYLPCLLLINEGEFDSAKRLIEEAAIWICDRYEDGIGLASFGAEEKEEVSILLGSAFDFIEKSTFGSFAATVITDLSIFFGDEPFYLDIINDFLAVGINFNYWLIKDTIGMLTVSGDDIVSFPNIQYQERPIKFEQFDFADHIIHEISQFKIESKFPINWFVPQLSLLLRDRYFPTLWRKLLQTVDNK